jgi:hypothetical protein
MVLELSRHNFEDTVRVQHVFRRNHQTTLVCLPFFLSDNIITHFLKNIVNMHLLIMYIGFIRNNCYLLREIFN